MFGILFIVVVIAVVGGVIVSALKSAEELHADKDRVASKETPVTVGKYIHLIDAQAAQMRLESEDVKTYLTNENFVLMDPLSSLLSGGVGIQVKSSDAARAREVLAMKPETTEEPPEKYKGIGEPCPKCGSHNIYPYRDVSGILSLIVALLFFFIVPFPGQKRMHCFDCKHRWKMPLRKKQDKDSKDEWQKRMDKILKEDGKHWK